VPVVIEAGTGDSAEPHRANAPEVLILAGALLLVGSVFLPWLSAGVRIPGVSFDTRGWAQTEVAWPLFTCTAVAVIGLVAPARWLRYPFALLAAGAAGGVGYAWHSSNRIGPWIAMLGATVIMIGAFIGLSPRRRAVPPSSLTGRGSTLVIVGVLVMLVAGSTGSASAPGSRTCTYSSSSSDPDSSVSAGTCRTSHGARWPVVALGAVGGVLVLVGLSNRERRSASSPEPPRVDA
jgi:hypothetical protein